MKTPLRVLILDDSPADVDIYITELDRAGFDPAWQRVDCEADFCDRLDLGWDVILADYDLAQLDAFHALQLLKNSARDTPMIIISSVEGERTAVECMKQGAADYLLKDHLSRLGQAVISTLEAKRLREENQQAQATLHESEERYRLLFDNASFGIGYYSLDGRVIEFNRQAAVFMGGAPEDFTGRTLIELYGADAGGEYLQRIHAAAVSPDSQTYEDEVPLPTGTKWFLSKYSRVTNVSGQVTGVQILCADISERKHAEKALLAERNRAQSYFDIAATILLVLDAEGNVIQINRQGCQLLGYEEAELVGQNWFEKCLPPEVRAQLHQVKDNFFDGDIAAGYHVENSVLTKSGEQRLIAWYNTGIVDADDKIVGVLSSGEDITEQKQAERDLLKLSGALEHSSHTVFITDAEGRIEYTNPKFTELSGYAAERAIGKIPRVLDPARIPREDYEKRWNTIRSGEEWQGEFQNCRKDGTMFWERVSISSVRNAEGAIEHYVVVKEDITRHKQAEDALQESQRMLSTLMSNLPGMAFRCLNTRQWTMLFVSQGCTALTGYTPDDLLQSQHGIYSDLIHPDDRQDVWDSVQAAVEAQQPFQLIYRITARDGQERWVWEQGRLVGYTDGVTAILEGFITDITERTLTQERLRENEERYRMLFDTADVLISVYDRHGVCQLMNRKVAALFGGQPDDYIGVSLATLHPGVGEMYTQRIGHAIETGEATEYEDEVVFPTGARWLISRVHPVRDSHGEIYAAQIISHDITERKHTEQQLRKSEARYRHLFDTLPEGIYQSTPGGRYRMVNPAFARMLGYETPEELMATITNIAEYYADPADRDEVQRLFETQGQLTGHEIRFIHRNGQIRWMSIYGQCVYDDNGAVKYYDGFTVDITERKQAEEARQRYATRLEILHQLDSAILSARSPQQITQIVADHIYAHIAPHRLIVLDVDPVYDVGRVLTLNVQGETVLTEGMLLHPDSILGYADLLQGKTAQFEDLSALDSTPVAQKLLGEGVHSLLNVPMFAEDMLVGMLGLGYAQTGQPFAEDIDLLQEVGAQLAVGIVQARLREAEQEQRILAEALSETAHTVNNTLDVDEVIARIISVMGRVFPHSGANVMLTEQDERVVRVVQICSCYAEHGLSAPDMVEPIRIEDRALLKAMVETGRALAVPNVLECPTWVEKEQVAWVRSYLGAPIMSDGRVLGFINLDSDKPEFFTEVQARYLQAFADQVAIAIANARLFHELENYSAYLEDAVAARTTELRKSEARYRGIVEDQTELICRFKTDHTLTFVNGAYCRFFDRTPEAMVGRNFMLQIPPEDRPILAQQLAALTPENPIVTAEHRTISPDNRIRWVEWTNRLLIDTQGHTVAIQGVGRDITERKRAQQAMRQALEREVELGEMRMRFLSMASHDLRNPLAVIRSGVDMLSEYSDRMSEEKKRTKYSQIRTSIAHMVELLDDVLIIGRAESGKLEFKPEWVELETFCHAILSEIEVAIGANHNFDFVLTGQGKVQRVDSKLLRHILYNLLSNAVKYSPAGSTVSFDLIFETDRTIFRIQDEGIGIPVEDRPRLFKAFHRASNVEARLGTGLGLAIVKQSVDLHGGTISYETEVGVGSTFTVCLPGLAEG